MVETLQNEEAEGGLGYALFTAVRGHSNVIAQPYSTYFGEAWQVDYIIYDVLFGEALLSVRRVVEEVVECYMYSGEVLVTLTVKGATT